MLDRWQHRVVGTLRKLLRDICLWQHLCSAANLSVVLHRWMILIILAASRGIIGWLNIILLFADV